MAPAKKPIPEGFHSVTPSLVVRDAPRAIEFYKRAFGAQELVRMPGPDGKIMHAEIKIGDSIIFLGEENPQMAIKSPQTLGGASGTLNIYVQNVDETFKQAVSAGGRETMPVADQFWGDRYGTLVDPFGYTWGIATHKEELTPAEMQQRMQDFFAQMAAQRKSA
jgi:uncharacterized glyoxalase superfamily protein PhnB